MTQDEICSPVLDNLYSLKIINPGASMIKYLRKASLCLLQSKHTYQFRHTTKLNESMGFLYIEACTKER